MAVIIWISSKQGNALIFDSEQSLRHGKKYTAPFLYKSQIKMGTLTARSALVVRIMDIHPCHIRLSVPLNHTVKPPAISFIK